MKAVKVEIARLLGAEYCGSLSFPAEEQILNQQRNQEEREARAMTEKEERVELKMEQVMKKARALKMKLLKLEEMHDSQVREKLLESKEWQKMKDGIVMLMEKTQEDAIGTRVDMRPMKDLVDNLVT